MNEQQQKPVRKLKKYQKQLIIIFSLLAIGLVLGIWITVSLLTDEKPEPEIVTKSALEEIIHTSELSTFTAVYNGIAEVMNEKKADKTDYFVAYNAKVYAGIDFDAVRFTVDNTAKTVTMTVPPVIITEVTVDFSSLDFIFMNDKANTDTVTEQAYRACEEDVLQESADNSTIRSLAEENAHNVLTALVKPFLDQLDEEYTLTIHQEVE